MRFAALVTWILAALLGGYLLLTWMVNGGMRRVGGRRSRFAPPLILGHATLAATGLGLWVTYLAVGTSTLVWTALADLGVVAALGATMFGMWLKTARRSRGRHASAPRHAAEDHFPPPAVLAHGLFAVTTVVLVLVTALQAAG